VAIGAHQTIPCVVCTPGRADHGHQPVIPERGLTCEGCRRWARSILGDIAALHADLTTDPDAADATTWQRKDANGRDITCGPDPVNAAVPSGPTAPIKVDANVSGSREAPVPVNVDLIDLTGHVGGVNLTGRAEDDDQVGYVAAVTVLDQWMQILIDHRGRGEHRPTPTMPELCRWIVDRLDDACDNFPAVDEMLWQLADLRAALRSHAGLTDRPELKTGIPCRRCDTKALFRLNGSPYVECGACGDLMTADEYDRWTGLLAATMQEEKQPA
jgi:hypothetical protein